MGGPTGAATGQFLSDVVSRLPLWAFAILGVLAIVAFLGLVVIILGSVWRFAGAWDRETRLEGLRTRERELDKRVEEESRGRAQMACALKAMPVK